MVVTAAYEGGEHGMTANSFTSISLTPPLVLICTGNRARMTHLLESGMEFGLSVLAADQEDVGRHFAGGAHQQHAIEFSWRKGVPLISGALCHFLCRLVESRIVGDHCVHVAEVEEFECFDKEPIAFFAGQYTRLVAVSS